MKKIIMTQKVNEVGTSLASDIKFINADNPNPNNYLDLMKEADGLIVRIAKCDKNVIDNSPKLKVIGRTGVGYDSVDVKAATKRGIPVVITPGANSLSVAEHTLAFILALSKNLINQDQETRKGNWEIRGNGDNFEISGKTLGIVGFGAIGKKLAEMTKSLGMKIIWYDPYLNDSDNKVFEGRVNKLENLLRDSDFVSLHLPLTLETKNLISLEEFKLMKKDAFIINASRGGLVNEDDLLYSLDNKLIKGAALDVFEEEPIQINNKLMKNKNIIITPHSAAQTKEAVENMAKMCVMGCMEVLNNKKWPYVADKNVYNHPIWKDKQWSDISI